MTRKKRAAKGHLHQEKNKLQSTKPAKLYKAYIDQKISNIQILKTVLPEGESFVNTLQKYILEDAFPASNSLNKKRMV